MVKRLVVAAAVALVSWRRAGGRAAVPAGREQPDQSATRRRRRARRSDIAAKTFVAGSEVTVTLNSEPVLLGSAAADAARRGRPVGHHPRQHVPLGAHTIVAQPAPAPTALRSR